MPLTELPDPQGLQPVFQCPPERKLGGISFAVGHRFEKGHGGGLIPDELGKAKKIFLHDAASVRGSPRSAYGILIQGRRKLAAITHRRTGCTQTRRVREAGFEVLGSGHDVGVEGRPVAFLHPRGTGGVLTEFIEGVEGA